MKFCTNENNLGELSIKFVRDIVVEPTKILLEAKKYAKYVEDVCTWPTILACYWIIFVVLQVLLQIEIVRSQRK